MNTIHGNWPEERQGIICEQMTWPSGASLMEWLRAADSNMLVNQVFFQTPVHAPASHIHMLSMGHFLGTFTCSAHMNCKRRPAPPPQGGYLQGATEEPTPGRAASLESLHCSHMLKRGWSALRTVAV